MQSGIVHKRGRKARNQYAATWVFFCAISTAWCLIDFVVHSAGDLEKYWALGGSGWKYYFLKYFCPIFHAL
jgi:hypothetical protein